MKYDPRLNRLAYLDKCLISRFFAIGYCMVEVRVDNVRRNLLDAGEGLVLHKGKKTVHDAKHLNNPQWIIAHIDDDTGWDHESMALEAVNTFIKQS